MKITINTPMNCFRPLMLFPPLANVAGLYFKPGSLNFQSTGEDYMLYQKVNAQMWRNIWVVGDLHGCRAQLDAQLLKRDFNKQQDLLLSVGDLIDRGPDSPGCLALMQEPWFRCVRGNHEQMALAALDGRDQTLWMMNGGEWFWQLKGAALIAARHALKRCAELPLILHLDFGDRVVVIAHADYPASHYALGKDVDWQQVVWSRDRLGRHQRGSSAHIDGASDFYFGHTPLEQPLNVANQHYIDTGAVFGNRLTLVKLQ